MTFSSNFENSRIIQEGYNFRLLEDITQRSLRFCVFFTIHAELGTHLLQLLSNTLLKGFPRHGLRGDTKPTKTSELLIFVFLLDTTRHKYNSIGACRLRQDSKTFFLTVTVQ